MQAGPFWHYGYTVLTRYEGGLVPAITMRTHLACDAVGALASVGAAALLRDEPIRDRLLLAAIGLSELAVVAMSDRQAPGEDWALNAMIGVSTHCPAKSSLGPP